MAKRGRKALPKNILKIRGSWRADARGEEFPMEKGKPLCPKILKGEARKEWNRITKQLDGLGVLGKSDRALLTIYCEAWSEYYEIQEKINRLGLIKGRLYQTKNGNLIQNPLLGIRNQAAERLIKIAAQFGLSPSARAALHLNNTTNSSKDQDGKTKFNIA